MALTRRPKEVLDWIAGFIRSKGYSPSFEEIAQGIGSAPIATVHKHLTALEVRGESMIDDHIMEGDYVLVENTKQVRDGDRSPASTATKL